MLPHTFGNLLPLVHLRLALVCNECEMLPTRSEIYLP